MPGTAIARRTSFLSFAHNQVLSGSVTDAEIPLFQAFSPIPVQGSTDDDCIKVGRKIDIFRCNGIKVENKSIIGFWGLSHESEIEA